MKTILVPTDFSEVARNATEYAVQIAKKMGAKIKLLHVCQSPPMILELPMQAMSVEAIEEYAVKALKDQVVVLHGKYGNNLTVDFKHCFGDVTYQIIKCIEDSSVDMVVMGMSGANYLAERLIGNVTTTVIRYSKCPVLAIGGEVRFKEIKNIVLACDAFQLPSSEVLGPMKQIVRAFSAKVFLLNVVKEQNVRAIYQKSLTNSLVNDSLLGIAAEVNQLENKDVAEGIMEFANLKKIDMVVMIPGKHTLLEQVYMEPNTRKVAFHTKLPLLTLPNAHQQKNKRSKSIHHEY